MIETLSVTEVINPIVSGMTEPFLCRLSDDNLYAVKGRQALVRGLISEAVCAYLARRVGIPIPDFVIAYVDQELVNAANDPAFNRSIGTGYAFGSLWVEPTQPLPPSLIPKLNRRTLATIYAFDHWVKNGDRSLTEYGGNPNLLVELETSALIAIDHNLAFSIRYSPDELAVHACRNAWLDERRDLVFTEECRDKFRSAAVNLHDFMNELPDEWLEAEEGFFDEVRSCLDRASLDRFWDEMG